MSFARKTYDGEQAMAPEKRPRLRDSDLIKARAAQMLAQKLAGWKTERIAKFFRLTRQHVNREIKAIPLVDKKRIVREYRRGEIRVA